MTTPEELAAAVGARLQARDRTLAVAESLTGGRLAAVFAAAPGASAWFVGGVVASSRRAKRRALKVPDGPVVSQPAAVAMAEGVAHLLGADVGLAVAGAAGPESRDGCPPGTVWLSVWRPGRVRATCLRLDGDDREIAQQTVRLAVRELAEQLDAVDGGPRADRGPGAVPRRRRQAPSPSSAAARSARDSTKKAPSAAATDANTTTA